MHGVVLTPTFERQARRAGLTDDEVVRIASAVALDPTGGALVAGTGGARKMRHPGRGKGKSGGYRTIHFFGGLDLPVFLLAIYGKGEKDNLTKSERSELAAILPRLADAYRGNRT